MISGPSAHDAYQQIDDRGQLIEALRVLAPGQRAAIVLRYFCDLDDATIAGLLGCSQATVRSQVSRGLNHLRVVDLGSRPRSSPANSRQERS